MAILVYKLTCAVTDKSYVGITARALDTRWLEHCQRARHGTRAFSRLYQAMQKYGLDAWTREVIATCDTQDEARSLEKAFIIHLGTFANGYNANEGGHGWLQVPEEVRRKSSEAQKGKVISPETRARMSAAKKGKPECADHFGDYTQKGAGNPLAREYVIRLPDGTLQSVRGLRSFCRKHGLQSYKLKANPSHKGFSIIQKQSGSAVPSEIME